MRDSNSGRSFLVFSIPLMMVATSGRLAHASTPVTACGQVLSTPGDYHLTENLGPCPGHGLVIAASNVHLNLAGFTLSGMGCDTSDYSAGITVAHPAVNLRVEGGRVTSFTGGIHLTASESRVSGMTVRDNCVYGIFVSGTDDMIDTNVVAESLYGVILLEASNITVHSNDISANDACGVCAGADGSTIRSNLVRDNGRNAGEGGIVVGGTGNTIRGNVTVGNFDGISLGAASSRTYIGGNTANANAHAGIAAAVGSTLNRVIGNSARSNGIVDLSDHNAGCDGNRWRRNIFATDSVAGVSDGGPGAGCIK